MLKDFFETDGVVFSIYPVIQSNIVASAVLLKNKLWQHAASAVIIRSAIDIRGIAQSGSAPALGAGCREFESLYPDQISKLVAMDT